MISVHVNQTENASSTNKVQVVDIRKRFTCDKCNYKATTQTALQTHIVSTHQPKENKNKIKVTKEAKISKRITCDICQKRFNKQETYQIHMGKFHEGTNEAIQVKNGRSKMN